MPDRPRNESAILRRWVILRLNVRLKGYVLRRCLWTVKWGNGYITTLPLEVFTQRNFVVDFIQLKLNFIFITKTLFQPPFRDLIAGIVCAPSIARWKAYSRLPIRQLLNFFAIFYGWDVISGNLSKSAFSKGVGHFKRNFRRKRQSPINHCWCKLE